MLDEIRDGGGCSMLAGAPRSSRGRTVAQGPALSGMTQRCRLLHSPPPIAVAGVYLHREINSALSDRGLASRAVARRALRRGW